MADDLTRCEQTPTSSPRESDIVSTDQILGIGTYCVVLKVLIGETCAVAKLLHNELLKFEIGVSDFRKECRLLSQLNHPNIVKFITLYWPEKNNDATETPWLILEYLPMDLNHFLDKAVVKSISVKVSILMDISHGLLYLHNYERNINFCEYIVHCDLSSYNILLTEVLMAKISDFGTAIVITSNSKEREEVVSFGASCFMPPEVKLYQGRSVNCAICTPKLDVFSFGVIILHTINEILPGSLALGTFQDYRKATKSTSVDQRAKHYKTIDECADITMKHLVDLSKHCLNDDPAQRPHTNEVVNALEKLKVSDQGLERDKLF